MTTRPFPMSWAIGATLLAVGFTLLGCQGPIVDPAVTPGPRSPVTTPAGDRANAINRVCYAFHEYDTMDLARPTAEGHITYLAGLPGVPPALRTVIVGYWGDPGVRDPAGAIGSQAAREAYGRVNAACVDHLWHRSL